MKKLGKLFKTLLVAAILGFLGVNYVLFFPYIHKRTVYGPVRGVKQIFENLAIVSGSSEPSSKVYSFAVAVQDKVTGEIVTGSSEDRQWGVVKENQCVEAVFFPYPPWNLQKSGTYNNVRLKRLFENCETMEKQ